jgi:hypothetical protein
VTPNAIKCNQCNQMSQDGIAHGIIHMLCSHSLWVALHVVQEKQGVHPWHLAWDTKAQELLTCIYVDMLLTCTYVFMFVSFLPHFVSVQEFERLRIIRPCPSRKLWVFWCAPTSRTLLVAYVNSQILYLPVWV